MFTIYVTQYEYDRYVKRDITLDFIADKGDEYKDFKTLGQARVFIDKYYDDIVKSAIQGGAYQDDAELDDELHLCIYENNEKIVGDYIIMEKRVIKKGDNLVDFVEIYECLNDYKKQVLQHICDFGGYELLDYDNGILPMFYFESNGGTTLKGADFVKIKDIETALQFYDNFTADDKENGIDNHTDAEHCDRSKLIIQYIRQKNDTAVKLIDALRKIGE